MSIRIQVLVPCIAFCALLAGCDGRPRSSTAPGAPTRSPVAGMPSVAEFDLTRGVPETVPQTLFGGARGRTHFDLIRALRALPEDRTTKGVVVRIGGGIGLTQAHEIGRILGGLRKGGMPIVCHANDYTNATLLLSSLGCSSIWMTPVGQVDSVGIALQLVFAKALLDKLHVSADFVQIGKYKGAEEPFTREGPSPEARETLESTVRSLRDAWLGGIAEGRGKPEVAALLEQGPYAAPEAKANGIIDEIGYLDDAREQAKKLASAGQLVSRFGSPDDAPTASRGVVEILRTLTGSSKGGAPHVTVLRAQGSIAMSSSSPFPFGGNEGISERELGRQIAQLDADASTKAVVLRIDSPGGSATASDLLWKRLMKLRGNKPLVVSIGGMAASGGYYLACAGTKIFAEPTSIIGSIGVVGGKFSLGTALEELGVHGEIVTGNPDPAKGRRAAYLSPLTRWDDETRDRIRATMQVVYDVFLERVAEGRGKPAAEFAPSAEGRLFGGLNAKERGLVDEVGGLEDALRTAIDLAKLPADAPIEVVGDTPSFIDLLDGDETKTDVDERAKREVVAVVAPELATAAPELRAFIGSVAPLLSGERVLTALPYVVLLR